MTSFHILVLLGLFQLKHFVVDFLLQPPYMYLNKGTYGHMGGLLHAQLHAVTTGFIVWLCGVDLITATVCAAADFMVHYHVDYWKVNLVKLYVWKPDKDPQFWYALGLDQMLHQMTYVGIVGYVVYTT